jgi:integrase
MAEDKGNPKGKRNEGSNINVVTLADGTVRYRLKFYIGVDPETGKREFHNETFDTKADATNKAAKLRTDRAGGVKIRPTRETLSAYLKRWLKEKKKGNVLPRTFYDYENILRRYIIKPSPGLPRIGRRRVTEIQDTHFDQLFSYMRNEKELSHRTVQYLRAILFQAMRSAVASNYRMKNPVEETTVPKYGALDQISQDEPEDGDTERQVVSMTKGQALAFQEAAKEDRYYPLWVLLLHTGMRPSEAVALKWTDLDLDKGSVRISKAMTRAGVDGWALAKPKTKQARRTLTIGPSIVRVLKAWKAKQGEGRLLLGSEYQRHGFVFATEFGGPVDQGNLNNRNFRRICERAHKADPNLGMGEWVEKPHPRKVDKVVRVFKPNFWTYCLRHTYATLLLADGEAIKTVSAKMGHKKATMTLDTYASALPEMEEGATARMEALLGQG